MAITNMDELLASYLQPHIYFKHTGSSGESGAVFHSLLIREGLPGAATVPTPGMAGTALTSMSGAHAFSNPTGGKTSYLAGFHPGQANVGLQYYMADRLWHNSGIVGNTLTAQTVDSVAWPARDENGSTDGVGVMIGLEVTTATTNGAEITDSTISYTNSAGTSGRTATLGAAPYRIPITATLGSFIPYLLQEGDVGVRSIQSITFPTSIGASAVVHLVAFRVLAWEHAPSAARGRVNNFRDTGMPVLYDNTVIWPFFLPSSSASVSPVYIRYLIAQG